MIYNSCDCVQTQLNIFTLSAHTHLYRLSVVKSDVISEVWLLLADNIPYKNKKNILHEQT